MYPLGAMNPRGMRSMSDSDPGGLNFDTVSLPGRSGLHQRSSSEVILPGSKKKSKRRQEKLQRSRSKDSGAITPSGDADTSDGDTLGNGDAPPKSRSRIKLWDSFLSKTRKIRIRGSRDKSASGARDHAKSEASKLQARAASHPNIPISAEHDSSPDGPDSIGFRSPSDPNKTFPGTGTNGRWSDSLEDVNRAARRRDDGNVDDDEDDDAVTKAGKVSRRYRQNRQSSLKTRTRSSSSNELDDSTTDLSPPAAQNSRSRFGRHFFNRQTPDEGYRSAADHNTSSVSGVSVSARPQSSLQKTRSVDSQGSVGSQHAPQSNGADFETSGVRHPDSLPLSDDPDVTQDGAPQDTKAGEKDEDDVPVIEQTEAGDAVPDTPVTVSPGLHSGSGPAFYMLSIHLKEGRDLVIRDSCGTSDPYVKFKVGNKQVYKSRTIYKNLNPRWDEQFTIPLDDISKPISIKVLDYDRAWNDDPMGGADIDLTCLDPNKETELKLLLTERGKSEYMGYLLLNCTLVPKSDEDKDQSRFHKSSFFRKSTRVAEPVSVKKTKMQLWSGVVTVVLVEGRELVPMDDNGLSDPYVKFRLGTEKCRSKFKTKTLNPRWLEQFDFRLYDEQGSQLEITVYDHDTRGKDDFMGRAIVDVSQLEKDKTHELDQPLEDGAGIIRLLVTVSGTCGSEVSSDLANYTPHPLYRDTLLNKYKLFNFHKSLEDVGELQVKVFRAHGLHSADFGGLSDPFCVLELVNARVQTHTEYKTLNPEWAKVFTFQVKDIHSVLEVTVFDEDRNKKVEFLGKVAIPLLRVRNGERRWYALKDRKMVHKTKGAILLEMDVIYNHIKAGIRTINPAEEKMVVPEQKFKISTMKQNVNRVSQLIGVFIDTGRFIQSCFDWQSPARSITAFIVYLVIVWNFELYMLPISLLIILMKNLVVAQILGSYKKDPVEDDYFVEEEDDEDDDKDKAIYEVIDLAYWALRIKTKQEEKKSIVDRYHAVQEVCLQVQQALDMVACLGERVKNTFNWSVPWLSMLAVLALSAGVTILYFIPLRMLLLAWGINKFTKKLRKPNAISNNEVLDFLSRVPSDNELLQYRELRPDIPANTTTTKKKRS